MNNIILMKRINEYLTENRRKILLAMGLLVAFLTVYLLTFPASTLDKQTYCGQEEHKHTEECYGENNELICTKAQHEHTLQCSSNPDADVETAEQWEKSFADVQLTDSVEKNAALIAVSQIGYAESTANYKVADEENNILKGYTRYGDAFGDRYADWSVPFCSFVLHYAGADDQLLPKTADAGEWLSSIMNDGSGNGLTYHAKGEDYRPAAGDIVFLSRDGENSSTVAAVVTDTAEEAGKSGIFTVQGDAEDRVGQTLIGTDDEAVIGYASLPSGTSDTEKNSDSEKALEIPKLQPKTVQKMRFAASPYTDAQIAAAINEINSGLGLASKTYGGKSFNLSINGTLFTKTFYYDNIMKDLPVTGTTNSEKAESYGRYLAGIYLDAGGGSDGLAAVKEVWDRYILDIFDPNQAAPKSGTYGDEILYWTKEATGSSFHAGSTGTSSSGLSAGIKPLDYEALKNGIDYSAFMSGLHKNVTAAAAGDSNSERKYDVKISAEAQAKGKGPVAMIIQIQTAWQLFDLTHANAPKGGYAKFGATSRNDEIANLYDIKKGLLKFAEYMDANYKGNNLVLGISEVRHGGSDSMFYSSSVGGAACYVTNDADKIKEGILGFDSFGNCEHVHYDTNTMKATCTNLSKNLTALTQNVPLSNDDISKCVVIIGGTTEASSGTGGYGCVVPWSTMSSSGINSVYAIKTNSAEQADVLDPSYYPSWLDYPANNAGAPYNGTGTNFTEKYKALTSDAVCDYLIQIAEKEMASKSINIDADTSAEDVVLEDTVQREFILDKTKSIKLNITDNKTNDPVAAECREFEWHDEVTDETTGDVITEGGWFDKATGDPAYDAESGYGLTVTENADGTTTVTYDVKSVHNGRVCELDFGIAAKSDYIGSNNVKSNVGTPELTYGYNDNEGNPTRVPVKTKDTPEVNVPIRYTVADGGSANVDLGTSVDLASLGSDRIVENAHSLLEKYEQISGTLTYVWEMPDGTKKPVPITVEVKDGKIVGDFANKTEPGDNLPTPSELSQMLEALQQGTQEAKLHVIFTPTPVTNNGNFSDSTTAAGVNKKDLPGKVTITTPISPATKDIKLQKIWDPKVPKDANGNPMYSSLNFRITARDKAGNLLGYVKVGTDGKGTITQNPSDAAITLSSTDALADNSAVWQREIKGLPGFKDKKDYIYTVEEISVPVGYSAEYSSETVIEETDGWQCQAPLTLKLAGAKNAKDITVVVEYKANSTGDTLHTYKIDGVTTNNNGDITSPKPLYIYDLPVINATETSASADTAYTITNVYTIDSSGSQSPVAYDKGAKIDRAKAKVYKYRFDIPVTVKLTQCGTGKNPPTTLEDFRFKVTYRVNGEESDRIWYSDPIDTMNLNDTMQFKATDIIPVNGVAGLTVKNVKVQKWDAKSKAYKDYNDGKGTATAGTPEAQKATKKDYLGVTTLKTVNKESIASVEIEKIVQERLEGVTEDTEFEFRASMKDSDGNSVQFADTTVPAGDTHDTQFSDDGTSVTFRLKSGEKTEFRVPLGFYLEVQELNAAGYYPLIKEYKKDGVYDDTAEIKVTKPEGTKITIYNKCGYELPNTGGSGELIYMMCGLMLVIFTIVCGLAMRRKKRGGWSS